ncbi:MAG TPA: nucleotidyltransferase family protein [Chakrabartia sp.]|jgi:GTP:adenosylcobinamide-phosphate guanylyltransferase|nr:nucleotidyltransferase family protein [Chakrabartia sp.]
MNAVIPQRPSAIILAGRRTDRLEPLAQAHRVSDKCLVPVGGLPLIEHVAGTLSTSPWIDRIVVSVNEPNLLKDLPRCRALIASGRMLALRSKGNLADSVLDAAAHLDTPILITTADNVLLTHQAIAEMAQRAAASGADAAIVFARKADILAAHPEGQRRFYEFRDGGYSNCNCYWLSNKEALKAADVFRSGGQFAKNPLRIASAFGLFNLVRFRLGIGTLAEAMQRISKRLGLWISPIVMDDGSLAIDVDNERTHRVVGEILAQRQSRKAA